MTTSALSDKLTDIEISIEKTNTIFSELMGDIFSKAEYPIGSEDSYFLLKEYPHWNTLLTIANDYSIRPLA